MSEADRTMLSFPMGGSRFNYRVAGIALRQEHVLVCRDRDDDYVMLPGGRVEFGETSLEALEREIAEELQCPADIGQLQFTAENLFERGGEEFHEIAVYYGVTLPADFPFEGAGQCLVTHHDGQKLTFYWVPVEVAHLKAMRLYPDWIHAHLASPPQSHRHMLVDER